LNSVRFSRIY